MADSSKPSLAIIVSCAAVGGLIFIFLAVRIGLGVYRRRRHKPVPLPPARPLAALHTLPWNANPNANSTNFSASKLDLSSPASSSPTLYHLEPSMMQRGPASGRARNVYRQYSGSTLNTEEMPLHQPPSPITRASSPAADATLVPPQPFFSSPGTDSNRSSAQISLNASTEEFDIASYPPQRHQSVMAFSTDALSEDVTCGSSSVTPYPPDPSSRMNGATSRRVSLTGSVSTIQTNRSKRSTRSLSTVRGPPHKPYSRVEIILPTPLAPQNQHDSSYLHEIYGGNANSAMSSRQSVCDPWLRIGLDSMGPVNNPRLPSKERERRHRTVSSESQTIPRIRQPRRPSASSISSFTATGPSPNPNAYLSRSSSGSSQSYPHRRDMSLDMPDLPPVPRVPSMYSNFTNSPASSSPSPSPVLALSDSITGNGILKGLESDSSIRNRALPSSLDVKLPSEVTSSAEEGGTIPAEAPR